MGVRDHLFEVVDGFLHICAVGDIVLNLLMLDPRIPEAEGLRTRSMKGATGIPRGFARRLSEMCERIGEVGRHTFGTTVK